MNENPSASIAGSYQKLGSRTYWLFLAQRVTTAVVFLVLAIIFSIARSSVSIPAKVIPFLGLAGVICFVICFVALAVALISAWIVYRSHEFCLADNALKIRQGVVTKQELAIPYRQIQNVDIERSAMEQMLGLSRVIVLTAGHEDALDSGKDEAEGDLPAMDKHLASALQEELLKRANVQKVVETKA